eukprot:Sdes_comp19527_c0_seq1m11108
MASPRDHGYPELSEYQTELMYARFDKVKDHLLANNSSIPSTITSKELALKTYHLQRIQDISFGASSTSRAFVKLPAKLFKNYSPAGPLCTILKCTYKFLKSSDTPIQLESKNIDSNLVCQLFSKLHQALSQAGFLDWPKLYFYGFPDDSLRARLEAIAVRHHGTVVSEKSQATCIIYHIDKIEEDEDWMKPLMIGPDSKSLVHWWYYPDSYDSWIPTSELEEKPQPPVKHVGPWHLNSKFVTLLERFNEWLNEEDFELNPEELAQYQTKNTASSRQALEIPKEGATLKRSRSLSSIGSNPPEPTPKKSKTETTPKKSKDGLDEANTVSSVSGIPNIPTVEAVALEVDEEGKPVGNQIQPYRQGLIMNISHSENNSNGTIKEKRKSIEEADVDVVDYTPHSRKKISKQNQDQAESPEKLNDFDPSKSAPKVKLVESTEMLNSDDSSNQVLASQRYEIIIPSHSSWFCYDSINEIERRALPEFFTGKNKSKTPEIYLAYRNFLIDTYRLNPNEYLTATACRRNLVGDVCSIIRVHAFLEQWGLINYQVSADCVPSGMGPPPTNHFTIMTDTPFGLYPLIPSSNPLSKSSAPPFLEFPTHSKPQNNTAEAESTHLPKPGPDISLRTDLYAPDGNKWSPCSCCASPLTSIYYQHSVAEKYIICPHCFGDGKYPAEYNSAQFTKLNVPNKSAKDWTDQETLLLLEGLELYKDDWNKVADHVSTRTQDECILHFLQLPIEDPYLTDSQNALGVLKHQPIPFSSSNNPIMCTVAFLASVVDPSVASAAAKAALKELSEKNPDSEILLSSREEADSNPPDISHKDSCTTPQDPKTSQPSKDMLQVAAASALAASAAKANVHAKKEEKRLCGLVAQVVEAQLKKIQLKLTNFEQLEELLAREREHLEKQRQQLFAERLQFYSEKFTEPQNETPETVN